MESKLASSEELRRGESKGDGDQDEEADKPEDAWSQRSVKSGVVEPDHVVGPGGLRHPGELKVRH